jgi:hypothetical protein
MELSGVGGRDDAVALGDRARRADFDGLVGDAFPRDEDDADGRRWRGGVESSSTSISPPAEGSGRDEGNSSSESGEAVFSSGTKSDSVPSSVSAPSLLERGISWEICELSSTLVGAYTEPRFLEGVRVRPPGDDAGEGL